MSVSAVPRILLPIRIILSFSLTGCEMGADAGPVGLEVQNVKLPMMGVEREY